MISAVSSTESVVWVMKATCSGSSSSSASTSATVSTRTMLSGRLAGRALDLLVALVADEDDRVALLGELARLDVDLGHQRAGGVDRAQAAGGGVGVDARRDAVGGEDDQLALGDLGLLLDEDRAALGELLDHVLVVDDLLAHVDGRPVHVERLLDRLHGAVDARAVAARRREQDPLRGASRWPKPSHQGSRPIGPQRIRGIAPSAASPTASRLSGQTLSSVSSAVCQYAPGRRARAEVEVDQVDAPGSRPRGTGTWSSEIGPALARERRRAAVRSRAASANARRGRVRVASRGIRRSQSPTMSNRTIAWISSAAATPCSPPALA